VATFDHFDLLLIGGILIFITLTKLDEMSKLDKIVELSSGIGGFFIGSIFMSYYLKFVSVSLIAGYLIYYSTVMVIIHDFEVEPPSNTTKFLSLLLGAGGISVIYLL
jgi:hypothetical protein